MKHTENQHRLHTAALEALDAIQECRKSIRTIQDNMVQIEKNPVLTRSVKNVLLDSYESAITDWRSNKDGWVERYAEIMQQLTATYVNPQILAI